MVNIYHPTLGSRFLGGLQGVITAINILSTVFTAYTVFVFSHTKSWIPYASEIYSVVIAVAFVIGWRWVVYHTKNKNQGRHKKRQRIDYILLLLIGWPIFYFMLHEILQNIGIRFYYNGLYVLPIMFGFGAILFATFVVYYLETGPLQLLNHRDISL